MNPSCPEIHAVAELAAVDGNRLWFELPPEPWPHFVRLCRAASEKEVALVVRMLCCYGRPQEEPVQSAEEDLEATFPIALPGGLAVVSGDRLVAPSCCCGLETWHEWQRVLSGGGSPWTGHDPAPLVEVIEGEVRVWLDGALRNKPTAESPLVFTPAQFQKALDKAAADIEGFLYSLRAWLEMKAPDHAEGIAEKFRDAFVVVKRPA
jgi:hypothetical protein